MFPRLFTKSLQMINSLRYNFAEFIVPMNLRKLQWCSQHSLPMAIIISQRSRVIFAVKVESSWHSGFLKVCGGCRWLLRVSHEPNPFISAALVKSLLEVERVMGTMFLPRISHLSLSHLDVAVGTGTISPPSAGLPLILLGAIWKTNENLLTHFRELVSCYRYAN